MDDEKKACEELRRPIYRVAEDRDMVPSRQTMSMSGEGCMASLSEANVRYQDFILGKKGPVETFGKLTSMVGAYIQSAAYFSTTRVPLHPMHAGL